MKQEECQELLNTLMVAVNRAIDARLGSGAKSELGSVRLVNNGDVYVRPYSDVSTPTNASPSSVSQLDDGDIKMVNITGLPLSAGDNVEVIYATSINDAAIIRKLPYTVVDPTKLPYNLSVVKPSGTTGFFAERSDTGTRVGFVIGEGGDNHGVYSYKDNRWIIYEDANGYTRIPGTSYLTTSNITTANLTTANITNTNLTNAPTIAGHSSKVGTIKTSNLSSNKTIATATNLAVVSLSLEAGTWIVVARARFSANANGYRHINISTTSADNGVHIQVPAVNGAVTQLALTRVISLSSTTTIYMNAYQNSGSSLTMAAGSGGEINALTAIRIL